MNKNKYTRKRRKILERDKYMEILKLKNYFILLLLTITEQISEY